MSQNAPRLIFGTAGIARWPENVAQEILQVLDKHNVKDIDTAYIYEGSEAKLKEYGVPSKSIIHTKAPGFKPGSLSKESVLNSSAESLKRLGVSQVETYYLHSPDESTPIEETLSAISQLYKEGSFRHFGLSNFRAEQVQQVYDIQSKNNAVLPTVYQGNYNAVSRHIEKDLFPVLKKLGIAFYAYSPIAGGFLVKTPESLTNGTIEEGRFSAAAKALSVGQMYNSMYGKPSLLAALEEWDDIAKNEGISKAALAYRWIAWHSAIKGPSDGVIIGASKAAQLEESLSAIKAGPLKDESVKRIEEVWLKVEGEAPIDNYHSFGKTYGA